MIDLSNTQIINKSNLEYSYMLRILSSLADRAVNNQGDLVEVHLANDNIYFFYFTIEKGVPTFSVEQSKKRPKN